MSYEGKQISVLGLGKSGVATCEFLIKKGAQVTGIDDKTDIPSRDLLLSLGVELFLGPKGYLQLANSDLVVVSPGVSPNYPGLSNAIKKNKVTSEIALARSFVRSKVLSVTGTNGKTTTASLVAHLLKSNGKKVCLAGNIGTPLISVLDDANSSDWVVLEVSSFQLQYSEKFSSDIAIWLNLTPDHLDWHSNIGEYTSAKNKLFSGVGESGCIIYNHDDEVVRESAEKIKVNQFSFSLENQSLKQGAFFDNKDIVVNLDKGGFKMSSNALNLEGDHNIANVLASTLAVCATGMDANSIEKGLTTFQGLPHRMEFVANKKGVKYINDSKGTNVGAVKAALDGLDESIVLIAGGVDKAGSWDDLIKVSKNKVKHAVLIGEAKEKIKGVFKNIMPVTVAKSMEEAVGFASNLATDGDVVLLSPACASFDMFANYAERGDKFKEAVEKL